MTFTGSSKFVICLSGTLAAKTLLATFLSTPVKLMEEILYMGVSVVVSLVTD